MDRSSPSGNLAGYGKLHEPNTRLSTRDNGQFNRKTSSPISTRAPPRLQTKSSNTAGLHNQITKLKEEDRHLAKDVMEQIEVGRKRLTMYSLACEMRYAFPSSPRLRVSSPFASKTISG
eukprot:c16822_g1_i1 orf=510-866(+)